MKKNLEVGSGGIQPMSKVLVSCRYNGEDNALAVGYCCNCSYDPPMVMVGIVPSRYSYEMIKGAKSFVVNIVPESYADEFKYLGSVSRRDEDKLAKIATKEAVTIDAPMLEGCPVNIECEIVDDIMTGSHHMFVGKITSVNADEEIVDDEGKVDFSKVSLI